MRINNPYKISVIIFLSIIFISCEKFIAVDVSKAQITKDAVFSNDITATAAVTGIYARMYSRKESGFANGTLYYSILPLCAISADELRYNDQEIDFLSFGQHRLVPGNYVVKALWTSMYKCNYDANSALEGLERSTGVSDAVKTQLKGESLFIRAFANFYLVNCFGDIPLITTIDYKKNAVEPRSAVTVVYNQIVKDLLLAKDLLDDNYVTAGRVRPNKGAAIALLARTYLYMGNWADAEAAASLIIDNAGQYGLVSTLDSVFLKNNREAIWQLMPNITSLNTFEGELFILTGAPDYSHPLTITAELLNSFEANDTRRSKWVNSVAVGAIAYHFPYKYKRNSGRSSNPPVPFDEYSMVLRLAEQYLIRAEARAQQNKLTGSNSAESDINEIRNRAGLPGTTASTQTDLLLAIEQERRIELFTEWGHRWFDLKRTGRADAVLGPIKANWNSEDVLYPLPLDEMDANPFLKPQNPGY